MYSIMHIELIKLFECFVALNAFVWCFSFIIFFTNLLIKSLWILTWMYSVMDFQAGTSSKWHIAFKASVGSFAFINTTLVVKYIWRIQFALLKSAFAKVPLENEIFFLFFLIFGIFGLCWFTIWKFFIPLLRNHFWKA